MGGEFEPGPFSFQKELAPKINKEVMPLAA